MKRIAISLLALALLLCACGQASPEPVLKTKATEASFVEMPPLMENELIIDNVSVNDVTKRFGAYQCVEAAALEMYAGTVRLRYDAMQIELYSGEYSFFKNYDWESHTEDLQGEQKNLKLTKADKAIQARVSEILWTDAAVIGPRGIQIGDKAEKVFDSYLDLRKKYPANDTDERAIIYDVSDIDSSPNTYPTEGFYITRENDWGESKITYDYRICYSCPNMEYWMEYSSFYIKDGKVVAMQQGGYEGC